MSGSGYSFLLHQCVISDHDLRSLLLAVVVTALAADHTRRISQGVARHATP